MRLNKTEEKDSDMAKSSQQFYPVSSLTADDIRSALVDAVSMPPDELFDRLKAYPSSKYFLLLDGHIVGAKLVIHLAWNTRFPGDPIGARDFRGDEAHVAAPLRALGFDVITMTSDRLFGHVPGTLIGQVFRDRAELSQAHVHRPRQGGISGSGRDGADSIVVSGGYVDDEDYGDQIIYTGAGGRDPASGRQIADQTLERGNLALATSCDQGFPVRVIRGSDGDARFSPEAGYRYDGLFTVNRYWPETGADGFRVWRFDLRAVLGEANIQEVREKPGALRSAPGGADQPERRESLRSSRVVRNPQLANWVKQVHEWSCQLCGDRVDTPSGAYAEAAHITPLGAPHDGPDQASNLLCLCPNCHKRFDSLARYVDPDGHVVDARTGEIVGTLRYHGAHVVSEEHLERHRERVLLAQMRNSPMHENENG
jgi:putative restriction endonuclease